MRGGGEEVKGNDNALEDGIWERRGMAMMRTRIYRRRNERMRRRRRRRREYRMVAMRRRAPRITTKWVIARRRWRSCSRTFPRSTPRSPCSAQPATLRSWRASGVENDFGLARGGGGVRGGLDSAMKGWRRKLGGGN
eukprot:9476041-Pyramimonas_sp.AAC.1